MVAFTNNYPIKYTNQNGGEMEIPLITTTIGSFPKPAYTPIRDWFDSAREKGGMNSPETTRNYQADLAKNIEKNDDGTYKYHRIVSLKSGITLINSIKKIKITVWYLVLFL